MFGRKKNKQPIESSDSYDDLQSDINPEDIFDESFPQKPQREPESQIDELPEEIQPVQQVPEQTKAVVQNFQPVKSVQQVQQPTQPRVQQIVQPDNQKEKEGISEEEVISYLQNHENRLIENSQISRILVQRSEVIEDRLKALESSIFRIRNS